MKRTAISCSRPTSGSRSEGTVAPEPGLHSSPRTQHHFARLSRLSIVFLLLLASQGCVKYRSGRHYDRGLEAVRRGDYDLAIAEFSAVIQLKPKHAGAYNNRGVSYAHKGDWDQAVADLDEAIRLNPEYVEAYYNRGSHLPLQRQS